MVAPGWIVEPVLDAGGFIHGYTYAGNPLACAAGLAVLNETIGQNLCANATAIGNRLKQRLQALMQRYSFIGDVRGKGLLLAMELVADTDSMEPLPPEKMASQRLVELAYERGLILYWRRTRGGYRGDHVMVCPPLITTEAQIEEIMAPLTDALDALSAEL